MQNSEQEWVEEKLYHSGNAFFRDLCEAWDTAQVSIDAEVYIFENDDFGQRIFEKLESAAARGVRVRLLVDGAGSPYFIRAFASRLAQTQVDVRIYHPLPWQRIRRPEKQHKSFAGFMDRLSTINRRNHRKSCVVDGKQAWVGGFNVANEYIEEFSGERAWRDSGIMVMGFEVKELVEAFEAAFYQKRKRRPYDGPLVHLNYTRALRKKYQQQMVKRINGSQQWVQIVTPYFSPIRPILKALTQAAERGVNVEIVVPEYTDVWFTRWLAAGYFEQLLKAGVRIWKYRKSILHAKTLIIDDYATVGSTNLNHRSYIHDLEVEIVVTRPENKRGLKRQFQIDCAESKELSLEVFQKRSLWARFLSRLFLLIRYWS